MSTFSWPKSEPVTPPAAALPFLASAPAALATVTPIKDLGDHPVTVEHPDDLPVFSRKLYDVVMLSLSLKHRVCPIDVSTEEEPKRFALVLLQSELNSDITEALLASLQGKHWTMAQTAYYVASPSVMDELARDGINANRKSGKGSDAKKHDSALWGLFQSAAVFALDNGASDIHIRINRNQPTSQIMFRIDGRLTKPREFTLSTDRLLDMTAYVYNMHGQSGSENIFNENAPQQCQVAATIKGTKLQFRWASNKTARGTKVVMRVIIQDSEQNIRTLAELGYLAPQLAIWSRAISRLGGGILISGVVNSGKSTSLQSVLASLPDWMEIMTVEDPVENLIPNSDQFSVSRSLTSDDEDPFLAAKRQTKRMDPDAVMIAEIRDRESAALFRDIAESGHRAFSTIHAPSATDIISLRLSSSELGIPRDVIATPGFLTLLVYQALVPKLCTCKKAATEAYDDAYLARIERLFQIERSRIKAENEAGCEACLRKDLPELAGTKGRLMVAEMIEPTPRMLLLFRDAKNLELKRYIRSQRRAGFDQPDSTGKSALEVAMYHVAHGLLDPKEVERKFGTFEQYERELADDDGDARCDEHS
ncbi:GspE/PulE family protein [Massilia sp. erpn]|uniref:GspE/PulE family protein n=1 Tax=Massilia sp. erpn TaxID=2738142 RepID=UPI00210531F2|nr:ATPase, T2SS/T4P/T4SS family [Massilia sp. erpn]UTY55860.1 Flp pilus assembly complex ATPase component TadA [Massilia sp. erpn]